MTHRITSTQKTISPKNTLEDRNLNSPVRHRDPHKQGSLFGPAEDAVKAGVWIRVSTTSQDAVNHVPELESFCGHHGYLVAARSETQDSAWNGGKADGEYRKALTSALDDAWTGRFSTLVVSSLDGISRGGAEDALRILRQFRERGCTVVSVKESWLNASPEVQDVLVAFAGWMAQQESKRRSERVRAAIERRKAEGTWTGRGQDKGRRKRTGYYPNANAARKEPKAARETLG